MAVAGGPLPVPAPGSANSRSNVLRVSERHRSGRSHWAHPRGSLSCLLRGLPDPRRPQEAFERSPDGRAQPAGAMAAASSSPVRPASIQSAPWSRKPSDCTVSPRWKSRCRAPALCVRGILPTARRRRPIAERQHGNDFYCAAHLFVQFVLSTIDLIAVLALGDWAAAAALVGENSQLTQSAGALHLMAKRGDTAAVRWLLDHGADPNARWAHWDADVTPLHLAAAHGHPAIVRMLLPAGTDPAIRDSKRGCDPLGWARSPSARAMSFRYSEDIRAGVSRSGGPERSACNRHASPLRLACLAVAREGWRVSALTRPAGPQHTGRQRALGRLLSAAREITPTHSVRRVTSNLLPAGSADTRRIREEGPCPGKSRPGPPSRT